MNRDSNMESRSVLFGGYSDAKPLASGEASKISPC